MVKASSATQRTMMYSGMGSAERLSEEFAEPDCHPAAVLVANWHPVRHEPALPVPVVYSRLAGCRSSMPCPGMARLPAVPASSAASGSPLFLPLPPHSFARGVL